MRYAWLAETPFAESISKAEQSLALNSLMLMMLREKAGYQTPVFMTFQQAKQSKQVQPLKSLTTLRLQQAGMLLNSLETLWFAPLKKNLTTATFTPSI